MMTIKIILKFVASILKSSGLALILVHFIIHWKRKVQLQNDTILRIQSQMLHMSKNEKALGHKMNTLLSSMTIHLNDMVKFYRNIEAYVLKRNNSSSQQRQNVIEIVSELNELKQYLTQIKTSKLVNNESFKGTTGNFDYSSPTSSKRVVSNIALSKKITSMSPLQKLIFKKTNQLHHIATSTTVCGTDTTIMATSSSSSTSSSDAGSTTTTTTTSSSNTNTTSSTPTSSSTTLSLPEVMAMIQIGKTPPGIKEIHESISIEAANKMPNVFDKSLDPTKPWKQTTK